MIEYRDRPLPAIDWPVFPDPAGKVEQVGDTVSIPVEYWLELARYVIEVEAGIELYEAALHGR